MKKYLWIPMLALIPVSALMIVNKVPLPNLLPDGWTWFVIGLAVVMLLWSATRGKKNGRLE